MKFRSMFFRDLFVATLSAWFFTTSLIDFVVLPISFRNTHDVLSTGLIGAKIFSVYNILEIGFSLILAICLFNLKKGKIIYKVLQALAVCLLSLTFFYKFYFTPNITEWTMLLKSAPVGMDQQMIVANQQFFHKTYVRLDSIKWFILLLMAIYFFISQIKGKKDNTL